MSNLIVYVVLFIAAHFLSHSFSISQSEDVHFSLNIVSSIGLFLGSVLMIVMNAAFAAERDE